MVKIYLDLLIKGSLAPDSVGRVPSGALLVEPSGPATIYTRLVYDQY